MCITISNYSDLSRDSSGLEPPVTPSSCYSDSSSFMETNLDDELSPPHSQNSRNNYIPIPQKNYLDPNRQPMSAQQKQRFKDRKLVRQKSCDYDSPPASVAKRRPPFVSCPSQDRPTFCEMCRQEQMSLSHPELNLQKTSSKGGNDVRYTPRRSPMCPISRIAQLQRSQSSGAENAQLKQKYCRSPCGKQCTAISNRPSLQRQRTKDNSVLLPPYTNNMHHSNTDSSQDIKSIQAKNSSGVNLHRSNTCESQQSCDTTLSCDLNTNSDWTAEEEECDEEVRRITGDPSTDLEDGQLSGDCTPIFSPVSSERQVFLPHDLPISSEQLSSSSQVSSDRQIVKPHDQHLSSASSDSQIVKPHDQHLSSASSDRQIVIPHNQPLPLEPLNSCTSVDDSNIKLDSSHGMQCSPKVLSTEGISLSVPSERLLIPVPCPLVSDSCANQSSSLTLGCAGRASTPNPMTLGCAGRVSTPNPFTQPPALVGDTTNTAQPKCDNNLSVMFTADNNLNVSNRSNLHPECQTGQRSYSTAEKEHTTDSTLSVIDPNENENSNRSRVVTIQSTPDNRV